MFASNDPLAPSDRTVTAQPRKSRAARYLFAVTASLLALFAASVFLEVSEEPSHAPLIGAIALIA